MYANLKKANIYPTDRSGYYLRRAKPHTYTVSENPELLLLPYEKKKLQPNKTYLFSIATVVRQKIKS